MDEDVRDIWVGSEYFDTSPRILILGESIYVGDDEPLQTYVPNWVEGKRNQTLTRVFRAFAGMPRDSSTKEQRWAFWNKIVFYNFATRPLGTRSDRPSEAAYQAAQQPLRDVLLEYRPDGVMVLGIGQAQRSRVVISELGITYVIRPHPTSYGLRTEVLTAGWQDLHRLIAAAGM